MLPFWTALAAYALAPEIPGPRRRFGFAMILAGAMVVSLWQIVAGADDGAWVGHLMFLTGSGFWAVYSVIFRQSGLSSPHALVIGLGHAVYHPAVIRDGQREFRLGQPERHRGDDRVSEFVIGILAMFLFRYAVRIIGAAEAAGVALVAVGVFLTSGNLSKSRSVAAS